ncbi:hypothetical protein F2Q70_00013765 [Brassica cretica]|uniref:Uncharacterized protein n=1 Tax=Brassica cretica TaxID=69181 RepID=A0A8S9M452_BRACR|nr:hypothetical protein F2Q70_00013765 [Brassica cretica]
MANNPAKSTPANKQGVDRYDGSLKRVAPSTALNPAQSGILIGLDLLFIGQKVLSELQEQSLVIEFDRSGSIHPKSLKRVVFSETDERRTKRRFDTRRTAPVRDKHPWPREREDKHIPLFDHFEDTHKAAKSSACRNRAIEDTWDDYDNIF